MGREDAEGLLQTLAWHFDEPFGDTSALPTYVVSRIARQLVTVVLTGDGGDEVLGGYPVHQSEKLVSIWQGLSPAVRRRRARFRGCACGRDGAGVVCARRAHACSRAPSRTSCRAFCGKQIGFTAAERRAAPRRQPARAAGARIHRRSVGPARARDGIGLLNYWLHTVALPERYLCKVDRCSMAHSLESRVPFLDPRLVELLAEVSPAVKMRGLTRKSILRGTIGRQLPGPLLTAGKRGFDPPMEAWLAQDSEGGWSEIRRPLGSVRPLLVRGLAALRGTARAVKSPTHGRVGSFDACRPVEHGDSRDGRTPMRTSAPEVLCSLPPTSIRRFASTSAYCSLKSLRLAGTRFTGSWHRSARGADRASSRSATGSRGSARPWPAIRASRKPFASCRSSCTTGARSRCCCAIGYDFVQVKDKFIAGAILLLAAKLTRTRFVYWLAYPFPEAWLDEARSHVARHPCGRVAAGPYRAPVAVLGSYCRAPISCSCRARE